MTYKLNPNAPTPLYEQLAGQLRRKILGGELKAMERLSSARDLSAELKINLLTVTKVYGLLVDEGLLEIQRGMGTFVSKLSEESLQEHRGRLLAEQLEDFCEAAKELGYSSEETVSLLKNHFKNKAGK